MKNILYSLFAILLGFNLVIAQTLMTDESHRTMINNFADNVDTVLLTECPQGMGINQFKKKIVNGEIQLSNTAKSSINNHASLLITYAQQFKAVHNLTTNNNAELYFLSSFVPSTDIQSGKLIELSPTKLEATEMWNCALESFNSDDCSIKSIVSDKNDIGFITKSATHFLSQYAGNVGVWIMISGFSNCIDEYNNKIDLTNKFLSIEDLQLISQNIKSFKESGNYQSTEEIPETDLITLLNPLIENGRLVNTEIMNLKTGDKLPNFRRLVTANEQINKWLNPTDLELVSFSLIGSVKFNGTTLKATLNGEIKGAIFNFNEVFRRKLQPRQPITSIKSGCWRRDECLDRCLCQKASDLFERGNVVSQAWFIWKAAESLLEWVASCSYDCITKPKD